MGKTIKVLRAWGNSVGIVIPKNELEDLNLSINDEVEIIITKRTNPLEDVFGKLKDFKPSSHKTNDEILKEIDNELKSGLD